MTVRVETLERTTSTNAVLLDRLRGGEHPPEQAWLRALTQSSGRGRIGRTWESPPGNLHCSTIVRLLPDDPPAQTLAFVAGLGLHDALAACAGPEAARGARWLKWPNDALIDGAKIAGVLLERAGEVVVVGIGVNVARAPELPGRATTSLKRAFASAGQDAGAVLDLLAQAFAVRLAAWRAQGLAATLAAWEERAHPRGTPLVVAPTGDAPSLAGAFAGLDPSGALRMALPDGSRRLVQAGEVTLGP